MKDIEEIYRLYKDDIFRYLISLTYDPNLSEDLLSETFVRAIKSIARFKGDSSIKTWLFSIARYTWYDHIRKDKKEVPIEELIFLHINEDLEMETVNREAVTRIMDLIELEDKRNQDIFLMRVEGYSFHDIGLKLGIAESSARVINHRLKNKIRNILEEEGLGNE